MFSSRTKRVCRLVCLWAVAGLLSIRVPAASGEACPAIELTSGHGVQQAIEGLSADDRGQRIQAFYGLYRASWPETDETLLAVLEDARHPLRAEWRIVRLLGMRGVREATSVLALILADTGSDAGLRRAAAVSLGELGGRESAVALLRALRNDPDSATRLLAIRAFYQVQGRRAAYDLERARAQEKDDYILTYFDWIAQLIRHGDSVANPLRPGETVVNALSGTKYLVYAPATFQPDVPHEVLVSVHGTLGTPKHYIDIVRERAEREGVVVVAPWFDAGTFPDFDNLNLGNVGVGLPRADIRLAEILAAVGRYGKLNTEKCYLFGHSRGGQFVQRFVFAHPHRVRRAAACAPGMYISADPNFAGDYGSIFPYGPEPNPFAPDLAARSFDDLACAPIKFFVGSEDERLTSAYRFLQEAQLRAARFGYTQQVELEVLPGVPHLGSETFPPAAEYLFAE